MDKILLNATSHLADLLFSGPGREMAYLDPGSGSYLLQLLIAGLFGAAFAVRMSWSRIKDFFRRLSGKQETDDELDE